MRTGKPAAGRPKAVHTALAALAVSAAWALAGCAVVKPYEREKLSDPVMNPGGYLSKQSLEQKFYSTREGSIGGNSGVGGGCGCSK